MDGEWHGRVIYLGNSSIESLEVITHKLEGFIPEVPDIEASIESDLAPSWLPDIYVPDNDRSISYWSNYRLAYHDAYIYGYSDGYECERYEVSYSRVEHNHLDDGVRGYRVGYETGYDNGYNAGSYDRHYGLGLNYSFVIILPDDVAYGSNE
ncbi:hypothetical protein THASP1DRAFT_30577 [Thamnocephalis sphaerospora]|uniref:Uncharacterized protein n=1 Tax=Thamnocephalis sphaerospora TaxID=78915 RepID=A0A4P9XQP0_9FUNG|nr:hypothetical protein THASP1DRAFT_30577 [Thamnocephalis sphaerospora]|eukprot:RKP07610.1 hypothetical protein THASP1DRAFT_30577 [Thamnocephalis sphaerospora]